jgi:hypothetical protein
LKNIKILSEAITRLKSTNRLMYNMTPLNFHWTIPLKIQYFIIRIFKSLHDEEKIVFNEL